MDINENIGVFKGCDYFELVSISLAPFFLVFMVISVLLQNIFGS